MRAPLPGLLLLVACERCRPTPPDPVDLDDAAMGFAMASTLREGERLASTCMVLRGDAASGR